jgi:hypothetical protein
MKNIFLFLIISILLVLVSCEQNSKDPLSNIDSGRYDTTWWDRSPIRLIQTNLPEIEADMDTDEYVKSIIEVSANAVLLNVGGIVANYPTDLKYHYKNPYMKGDLVGTLVEKLQDHNIKVFGRFDFSKVNEVIAAEKPNWLYVGTDGEYVNYNGQVHTCVNGGYQQEYVFRILTEALSTYPLDGIFFNMIGYQTYDYSGNYHGICQCENCKERYKNLTGLALPQQPDQTYWQFVRATSRELFNRIADHIRAEAPNIVIMTYTDAGVNLISTESSSSLSDEYEWNYSGTANVKPTLGSFKDINTMNLMIYFQAIGFRHVGTSPYIAQKWMLQNMLHAAPLTMVVIGTLVDYQDRVYMPVLKDLFGFHKHNEKLFTNVESVSDVALIRGSGPEYRGLIRLLSEEHILFDIIEPSAIGSDKLPRKLGDYQAVIIGDLKNMDDDMVSTVDNYVKNGGKLLATGLTSINNEAGVQREGLGLESLGMMEDYEIFPQSRSTYLKVSKNDKSAFGQEEFRDFSIMMMYSDFLKGTLKENAKGYFRLVPNTMFGPPEKCYFTEDEISDFPGVIVNSSGNGKSVFIPWQIGAQYDFKGNYAHRALFVASLKNVLGVESLIETDASPLIEMSHLSNRNGAFEWIGLINHSGQIGASFRKPVPLYNTTIQIKPSKPVSEIHLLRSGKEMKFKQKNGWVEVVVPVLDDFELILCLYK